MNQQLFEFQLNRYVDMSFGKEYFAVKVSFRTDNQENYPRPEFLLISEELT